jgi:antitoxin component YwqK of YwqJK toxin-antitoxin module
MDEPDQKHMKESIIEYYPNGELKHKIEYHPNGCKSYEQYYDLNGLFHRDDGLPDYQLWYENGSLFRTSYYTHGGPHNINNPTGIWFYKNGKINFKQYDIKGYPQSNKLNWNNCIKNII